MLIMKYVRTVQDGESLPPHKPTPKTYQYDDLEPFLEICGQHCTYSKIFTTLDRAGHSIDPNFRENIMKEPIMSKDIFIAYFESSQEGTDVWNYVYRKNIGDS